MDNFSGINYVKRVNIQHAFECAVQALLEDEDVSENMIRRIIFLMQPQKQQPIDAQ